MLFILLLTAAFGAPNSDELAPLVSILARKVEVRTSDDGPYVRLGTKYLQNWPGVILDARGPVEIGVHVRSDGDDLARTQTTADAIAAWLIEHGVPADKIVAKGYGGTYPLVDDDVRDALLNSRIELRLVKGKRPKAYRNKAKERALAGIGSAKRDEYAEEYIRDGEIVQAAITYTRKLRSEDEDKWHDLARALEVSRDALKILQDQGIPTAGEDKCTHHRKVLGLASFVHTYDSSFEVEPLTQPLVEDLSATLRAAFSNTSPKTVRKSLGGNCGWDGLRSELPDLQRATHRPLLKAAEERGLVHAAALHHRLTPDMRTELPPIPPPRPVPRYLTRADSNGVIDIGGTCTKAELGAVSFSVVSTDDWDPPGGPPTIDLRLEGTLACTDEDTETHCSENFSIDNTWDRYLEDGDWVYINTTSVGSQEVCQNVIVGERWGTEAHSTPDVVAYQAERRRDLFGLVDG